MFLSASPSSIAVISHDVHEVVDLRALEREIVARLPEFEVRFVKASSALQDSYVVQLRGADETADEAEDAVVATGSDPDAARLRLVFRCPGQSMGRSRLVEIPSTPAVASRRVAVLVEGMLRTHAYCEVDVDQPEPGALRDEASRGRGVGWLPRRWLVNLGAGLIGRLSGSGAYCDVPSPSLALAFDTAFGLWSQLELRTNSFAMAAAAVDGIAVEMREWSATAAVALRRRRGRNLWAVSGGPSVYRIYAKAVGPAVIESTPSSSWHGALRAALAWHRLFDAGIALGCRIGLDLLVRPPVFNRGDETLAASGAARLLLSLEVGLWIWPLYLNGAEHAS